MVKLRRTGLCVLLVFLVVFLVFPTLVLGANFGYETIGTSGTTSIANQVVGSLFTITQDGVANNITAYINPSSTSYTIKCAIYKHSDLSFVASTQERTGLSGTQWITFNFSSPPSLTANTEYILVAWSNYIFLQTCTLYYDAGSTNQGHTDSATYGTFPNPLVPTHNNNKYSIYCAYTPSGNPPTIGEFQAPNPVTSDSWVYLNATINDADGVGNLEYAQVELSGGIVLKWNSQGDVFSLYSDPNLYCVINASTCLKSSVNATAYKLSWRIQLAFYCPAGSKDVVATNTKVVDKGGLSGSNSQTGLFTLNKGTTYTDTSTDFTIESSSSISDVDWDETSNVLSFETEGNIVVEVGTYEDPTSVAVDSEEWTDWRFDESAKNVTIKGVSSLVEVLWGTYRYTFKGAYDEETGLLIGNVTVSVYSFNGESQSFELNSTNSYTYVLNLTYPPHCFQFELAPSINMTRYYYPSGNMETIYVWNATGTINHYSITFLDSIGFIDTSTYMEVQRYINGSTHILERIPINRATPAYLWLRYDRPYRLNLISSSEERVLEILADDDLEKELVISGITFSDQVKLAYKYVRVEAVRETSSKITINYEDTLEQTVSAYFEIQYRNGSQVWNASLTSSKGSVSWDEADSETGYIVEATIDHSGLCTLTFTYAVPALPQTNYPFDFAWMGNLPISTQAVVPVVAILFVAACFSTLTAGAGIVITVISAGIIYYKGWLPVEPLTLTIAMAFAIVYAISLARRRGTD